MSSKFANGLKISLLILILATLAFIFIQSSMPPEKSKEHSNAVGEIVEEIIPPDTKPGEFVQLNLRKIAHFLEFALLGLELSLYISLFAFKKRVMLASYPCALFIAFFDETVQIFSSRGPSIIDVWIDFLGFTVAAAIVFMTALIVKILKKQKT